MNGAQVVLFTDYIEPHVWYRPSGAYRIASELRSEGYTVQVIDCMTSLGLERLLKLVDKFVGRDTVLVGFSTTFFLGINTFTSLTGSNGKSWWFPLDPSSAGIFMDFIRYKGPNAKLVGGGPNAGDLPNSLKIDYTIIGYGEKMMSDLMGYLTKKNHLNPSITSKKLPNGSYLIDYDKKGELFNFSNSVIRWAKEDCIFPGESLPIEISRGCVFKCKFCSFPLNGKTKNDFIKCQDVMVEEFNRNYEEFGVYNYIFADDTHNDSTEKLLVLNQILPQLKKKPYFTTYLRLDLINAHKEQADILKENGLISAIFGIETLNHTAGKLIGKGLSPEKNIETLHWLREKWGHGIKTGSGFIVGLPGETKESINRLFNWLSSEDRPLSGFEVGPLYVEDPARSNKIWKSEFSIDPMKYGYTFDAKKLNYHWFNHEGEIKSFEDAHNLVMDFRKKYNKVDLHSFKMAMFSNFHMLRPDFHIDHLRYMSNKVYNNYMTKSYNYSNLKNILVDKYYGNLMAL